MLALLEQTSLEQATRQQLATRLRRKFPAARMTDRVRHGLDALEAEGLVEAVRSDDRIVFRATDQGLDELERRGRRPAQVAVLFTDLVDSTGLIAERGETAAHETRVRHFALLTACVEQTDGQVVKNLGDGLMVLHRDTADALECADRMQHAVADDADGLGLRVGVHRGDVLREGDDCFGMTVVVAKRLCDDASAGQIVVSQETLDDSPGDDSARPLGMVGLKGVPLPVSAYELEWKPQAPAAV